MPCRGIRGATTAEDNSREAILHATRQLLGLMIRENGVEPDDVASALLSMTEDLDAELPALAARQVGWRDVPLMCVREPDVPGSLARCIRVLLHWNTGKPAGAVVHVYIKGATDLRPDRAQFPSIDWAELDAWIARRLHASEALPSEKQK